MMFSKNTRTKSLLVVSALVFSACCYVPDAENDPVFGSAPSSTTNAEIPIPALGLHITAPSGSQVTELLGSQLVMGLGMNVNVRVAGDIDPSTIADARSEADLFTPTNFVEETLPDGFALTYQNVGSAGTNYWVTVRREIRGTPYMCTSMSGTADEQRAAVDACKSLR